MLQQTPHHHLYLIKDIWGGAHRVPQDRQLCIQRHAAKCLVQKPTTWTHLSGQIGRHFPSVGDVLGLAG